MKQILYYITALLIFTSLLLYSCKSDERNSEKSEETFPKTQVKLTQEEQRLNEEFIDFKNYALAEIDENDQNILKLRQKINEPGKTLDAARERRIEDLKEQNAELRKRLNNYRANTSDWESFKTNFNADLKDLGDSFANLFSSDSNN